MVRLKTGVAALALVLSLGGCKTSGPITHATAENKDWTSYSQTFLDGYFKQNPFHAVYQGRHEFDGKLPDWSPAGLQAGSRFLKDALDDIEEFDASLLTKEQEFERANLVNTIKGDLFWQDDADAPHTNVTWYFDNGLDPNVYIARPYADAATRMKAFIAYAKAVPAAVEQIKSNLKTPMPLSHIDYAVPGFKGLASYYQTDAKAAFASVKDAALQAEFDAAAKGATAAMEGMAGWMEGQRKTATQDFALGEAKFKRMLLDTESVDIPLDRLEEVGRADLKRNQDALKKECGVFAPGETVQACMAKMNASKGEGGPVAEARRQLPGLKQFLIDQKIVSIPGTEEALVEESPPYNRQNSAYIDIPGPYEKGLPSVYYISPPDPSWSKADQDAFVPGKKDLLYTSVHEVWPGHFLNFLHSNRTKSLVGRVFYSYAFAEGWAHYTEEMMWDAGLGKGDAESHIGQLSNALLRNCRYLSAIGLHARGMTQEQSKQMFITECFQDEGNARQQSARGTYDPAYINYTLGKLLIARLREDWTKGDRTKWQAFHDQFLSYGSPAIPLVRGAMMGGAAEAKL